MSDPDQARSAFDWLGRCVLYGAAVVGGWFLSTRVVSPRAENYPAETAAVLIAAGGVVYLVFQADKRRMRGREDATEFMFASVSPLVAALSPAFIIVAVLCIFGWVQGDQSRTSYLGVYCKYGAVSRAQLNGCMKHVNSDDIDDLETPAARFARGELDECATDSGPFCGEAAAQKSYDDQRDP